MAEATAFQIGKFEPTAFAVGYKLLALTGSYTIVGKSVGYIITGRTASAFNQGAFEPSAFALGVDLYADTGNYTITGYKVADYTLRADKGTYVIDYGNDEELYQSHILSVTTGSYIVTGYDVTLDELGLGAVLKGTYFITGNQTGMYRGYPIAINTGSYAISGVNAGVYYNRNVIPASGAYIVTGIAAGLLRQYPLTITTGVYSVSGYGQVLYNRKIFITADAYSIFGYNGALLKNKKIDIATGSYLVASNGVAVRRSRIFHAYQGSYGITGYNVISSFKKNAAVFDPLAFDSIAFATGYGGTVEVGQYNIVGKNVQFRITMPADLGEYIINTPTVNLLQGYKVFANSGVYNVAGKVTALIKTNILPITTAHYNISGKAGNVYYNKAVLGQSGAYNITGNVALRKFTMPFVKGVYTIAGKNSDLLSGRFLPITKGVYQKVGYAVQIDYGGKAGTGNYIFTGYPVTIGRRYELLFSKGTYTLTGRRVDMERSGAPQLYFDTGEYAINFKTYRTVLLKVIYGERGSYAITGRPANFFYNRNLKADRGTFTYTGRPAYRHFRMDVIPALYDFVGNEAYREVRYNPPDTGHYIYTGYNVRFNISLPAETGSFTLTGEPVDLKKFLRTPSLNVNYNVSGKAAALRKTLFITASDALYDIVYFDAELDFIRELKITKGTYLYTGHAVEGINNQFISAQTGRYIFTGNDIRFGKANIFDFSEKDQLIIIPAEDRIVAVAA